MAFNVAKNLRSFGAVVELLVPTEMSRKIRYIDRRTGEHLLRVDHDVQAQSCLVGSKYMFDAIVISDYDKGFVTNEVIQKLRKRFKGPIYMDTKKRNLADFPDIYIKINERELFESTSLPKPEHLIVTYGAKGCGYKDTLYPAKVIEVVDVCGAGDVFLAAMVYKHMETGDMSVALPFANEKAAISCQSIGAVCVS
jgi:D-beta-D-heptose 7-phosphate kinase/D-beta-D-heptose 1-phosphate adenosyltransferase